MRVHIWMGLRPSCSFRPAICVKTIPPLSARSGESSRSMGLHEKRKIDDIRRPMPRPHDGVNQFVQKIMKADYGRHILRHLAAMTPPRPHAAAAASEKEPTLALRT